MRRSIPCSGTSSQRLRRPAYCVLASSDSSPNRSTTMDMSPSGVASTTCVLGMLGCGCFRVWSPFMRRIETSVVPMSYPRSRPASPQTSLIVSFPRDPTLDRTFSLPPGMSLRDGSWRSMQTKRKSLSCVVRRGSDTAQRSNRPPGEFGGHWSRWRLPGSTVRSPAKSPNCLSGSMHFRETACSNSTTRRPPSSSRTATWSGRLRRARLDVCGGPRTRRLHGSTTALFRTRRTVARSDGGWAEQLKKSTQYRVLST